MIWPTDALQLAVTKLKTRRIRLIVTVSITSLMFGVLTFFAFVTEGVIHSVSGFSKEGYGNRFLVQATPVTYSVNGAADTEFLDHFKPLQVDLIAQKKAAAKKLNVPYDEATDQNLYYSTPTPDKTFIIPNYGSPQVKEYYQQKTSTIPGTDYESFQTLATAAGATKTYRGTSSGMGIFSYGASAMPTVNMLQNGTEDFSKYSGASNGPNYNGPRGMETLTSMGWSSMDRELMQPFVLVGQSLDVGNDGSVPTIAPASVAEEILGLKKLPSSATAQQKLERLQDLRTRIAGKSTQLCYRNGTSASLVSQTLDQQKEMEAKKNTKDYVKPTLQYQLPATPCGAVTIKSDTRTADEKKTADNQKVFDKQFGAYIEPEQGIISIRIVGMSPDISYDASMTATSILSSLLNSSMGGRWFSPNEAITGNAIAATIQGSDVTTASRDNSVYYAEFSSLKAMKDFVSQQTCDASELVSVPGGQAAPMMDGNAYTKACAEKQKVYMTMPYGNSSGAIEEFRSGIWQVARIAIVAVVTIAAIIMMGNVGKIIADSRRETAVFRALGAKGTDIDQIYLTYTLLVSGFAAIAAVVLGFVAAMYVNARYSADLSVAAVLAYGAQDVHKQFLLFGFNAQYIGIICGAVIVAGIFGAVFPLIANNRRNPIRDMRDDT